MATPLKSIDELVRGISVGTGQRHRIVVPRRTVVGRVVGAAFDTDKTFLKPGALRAMRIIREIFRRERPFDLLIVGHTDTVGTEVHNDRLSLARAESVKAFLKDDVQAWLDNYSSSQGASSRWGDAENQMMLFAMPSERNRPRDEDPVKFFQRTHELEPDGILGPLTRARLISEYMSLDGRPLSEEGPELSMTTHGCGEHFPLDESGRKVESAPADEEPDAMDRRVEVFLFSQLTGIDPAPPGPNSRSTDMQYGQWRAKARVDHESVLIEGESDFFVRLNVPTDRAPKLEETFRLFSLDGPYSITKLASEAEPSDGAFDIAFTRVKTELSYSLEITNGAGDTYMLFEDVPFSELDGHVAQGGAFTGNVLEPEPEDVA